VTSCGYDAELRRHNEVLRQACAVRSHDHVLDIGCGSGQTTREAARAARAGSALGVDVSAPAVERAREMAYAERIRNATFECVNAEVHRFPQERFDAAISRFGTMFFADPAAAFANTSRALRPAGRLVMMVWQAPERDEYYGPDVDAAMDWVRGFAYTREILRQLDPTAAERAAGRLREALATHFSDDGVWFNSRAWVVTARRR
jgi:ubiquinone/menaquinone biosynthesis C-methylase UbiE